MRAALVILALSFPAFAGDGGASSKPRVDCTLEQHDPDDLVARGKDLTVEPGKKVKDVLVVDGNVTVKKGAVVKTVFVTNGTVTIEKGATVQGAVMVVGGKVKVADRADVKKGVLTLDDGIHVEGQKGDSFDLNFTIDGQSLGQRIAAEIIKDMRGCKLLVD